MVLPCISTQETTGAAQPTSDMSKPAVAPIQVMLTPDRQSKFGV